MNGTTVQRAWLVAVVVLAIINVSQFMTNQNLRSDYVALRAQIERRAVALVADRLQALRHDVIAAGYSLHAFYQSADGLARPEGLWIKGQPDFEGIGAWVLDVYLGARLTGATDEEARQKMVDGIKRSDDWRQKHQ